MSTPKAIAQEELKRQLAEFSARRDIEIVFTSPEDAVKYLHTRASTNPEAKRPPVSVDMLVIAKEEFHGGWNLWLADKKHYPVSETDIDQLLAMKYRGKTPTTFRLSVWNNNRRRGDQVDPASVPIGSEIMAESVTGLQVYLGQVAQGNTSAITLIPQSTEDTSVPDHQSLSSNESSDEAEDILERLQYPTVVKKRATCSKGDSAGVSRQVPNARSVLSQHSDSDYSCEILKEEVISRRRRVAPKSKQAVSAPSKTSAHPSLLNEQPPHADQVYHVLEQVEKAPTTVARGGRSKRRVEPKGHRAAKKNTSNKTVDQPDPEDEFKSVTESPSLQVSKQKRKY